MVCYLRKIYLSGIDSISFDKFAWFLISDQELDDVDIFILTTMTPIDLSGEEW